MLLEMLQLSYKWYPRNMCYLRVRNKISAINVAKDNAVSRAYA
jgi:hypothetical protein